MAYVYITSEGFYAPECYAGHKILSVYSDYKLASLEFQMAKNEHDGFDTGRLPKDVLDEFAWWEEDGFGDDVRHAIRLTKKRVH